MRTSLPFTLLQVFLASLITATTLFSVPTTAGVEFPILLDSDDIAYFFEKDDLDGLYWALSNVFRRSERNPNRDEIRNKLPQQITSRGGGLTYTTEYKLAMDLEQADFLAKHLKEKKLADFFANSVKPVYENVLKNILPLEQLGQTQGLYAFRPTDGPDIGDIYNKALYQTNFEELKHKNGTIMSLLNPTLDTKRIERQWFGQDPDHTYPGIVIIDDLLSREALARIRQLMLESTVWYQTKMPLKFGGYVGAYIDDGLHDRILLQLAFELKKVFPRIMKGHPLKYLWAYKYHEAYTGINTHADEAAVNVNIWLTPDEANLDPTSGGLVVFTAKPPIDWEFAKYNTDTEFVYEQLLRPTNFANVTVPHKQNRAILFDSALFHHTDKFEFKRGHKNHRINLTLLYGTMSKAVPNKQEL